MVNIFTFPLGYLRLKDENGRQLFRRDSLGVVMLALVLSIPFWFTSANYFGEGGFIDKFGAFSGVLTGFYVAGLLSIASFLSASPSLDKIIAVGQIFGPPVEEKPNPLTRRQYVCSMFGYLSFLSLALSIGALLVVVIAEALAPSVESWLRLQWLIDLVGGAILFLINIVLAHMVATTCHGLYYLIDRLYAESATIATKEESAAAGIGLDKKG